MARICLHRVMHEKESWLVTLLPLSLIRFCLTVLFRSSSSQEVSRKLTFLLEEQSVEHVKVTAQRNFGARSPEGVHGSSNYSWSGALSPFVSPISECAGNSDQLSRHLERFLALTILFIILSLSLISTVVLPNVMERDGASSYKEFFSSPRGSLWLAYGRYVRPIREATECDYCPVNGGGTCGLQSEEGSEEAGVMEGGKTEESRWGEFLQRCRRSFLDASEMFGL